MTNKEKAEQSKQADVEQDDGIRAAVRSPTHHQVPANTDAVNVTAAPPGRSKKRKARIAAAAATANQHQPPEEETIRLGQQIEKTSERLKKGWRPVRLSDEDKAQQIFLDDAQLTASSSKGYRTVRATHGAHQGTWYFEAKINYLGKTGAVRVGWATLVAELQAPVGADAYGYGIRSVNGCKIHNAVRETYNECQGFKEGDVVGCLLHMPEGGRRLEKTLDDIVRYKGRYYFVEDDKPITPQNLPGSYIEFFINGISQGKAYTYILEGTYHPAISMYTDATQQTEPACVTVNFGDVEFEYVPKSVSILSTEKNIAGNKNNNDVIARPMNEISGP